jgi:hypothetical protein
MDALKSRAFPKTGRFPQGLRVFLFASAALIVMAYGGLDCTATPAAEKEPAAPAPEAECRSLDVETARSLVSLSLKCADKEYPNKPDNVLTSDEAVRPPRENTPAFFGCFDWHSSVHGHWAMVRILKMFPDIPEAKAIRDVLERHLKPENIAREVALFNDDQNKIFERPYGWGWFLRLAAELHTFDDPDARRWEAALAPLAQLLAKRTIEYLPRLTVPVRAGTHASTAFSLAHMLDYARAAGDKELAEAIERAAVSFYGKDRSCPTGYEPSGEDFISPCLAEADLMRRVLPAKEFIRWLNAFLPPLSSEEFKTIRNPVEVRDLKDPRIGHLIGLGFQRAWTMKGVASALPQGDPRKLELVRLANLHCRTSLEQIEKSGYGGEHWLATFTIYLLSNCGLAP